MSCRAFLWLGEVGRGERIDHNNGRIEHLLLYITVIPTRAHLALGLFGLVLVHPGFTVDRYVAALGTVEPVRAFQSRNAATFKTVVPCKTQTGRLTESRQFTIHPLRARVTL